MVPLHPALVTVRPQRAEVAHPLQTTQRPLSIAGFHGGSVCSRPTCLLQRQLETKLRPDRCPALSPPPESASATPSAPCSTSDSPHQDGAQRGTAPNSKTTSGPCWVIVTPMAIESDMHVPLTDAESGPEVFTTASS